MNIFYLHIFFYLHIHVYIFIYSRQTYLYHGFVTRQIHHNFFWLWVTYYAHGFFNIYIIFLVDILLIFRIVWALHKYFIVVIIAINLCMLKS